MEYSNYQGKNVSDLEVFLEEIIWRCHVECEEMDKRKILCTPLKGLLQGLKFVEKDFFIDF